MVVPGSTLGLGPGPKSWRGARRQLHHRRESQTLLRVRLQRVSRSPSSGSVVEVDGGYDTGTQKELGSKDIHLGEDVLHTGLGIAKN